MVATADADYDTVALQGRSTSASCWISQPTRQPGTSMSLSGVALPAGDGSVGGLSVPHAHLGEARPITVSAFAGAGAVLEAEKSRVLIGRALAASGRADEHLAHAGAPVRGLLRRRVARRGRPGAAQARPQTLPPRPPSPRDPLAPFSSREREVALLVAEGRTDPQIAAEVFLSGKTVESHVRSAFHKLSVTSRLELARLVDRSREQES